MTTEEIYIKSGYEIPKDKHDECSKKFDYWDMIAFADYETAHRDEGEDREQWLEENL